jgi:hypothetical protein
MAWYLVSSGKTLHLPLPISYNNLRAECFESHKVITQETVPDN